MSGFLQKAALGASVDFLGAQTGRLEQVAQSGRGLLADDGERLAVYQRQRRLVGGGPHAVPRPVKRIGHGRTQHVVQIHFGHLQKSVRRVNMSL